MKKRLIWTILLTAILALMWTSSLSQAQNNTQTQTTDRNFEHTYTFDVQTGHFPSTHKLYVSIPPTLYQYYNNRSHGIVNNDDYAKYVTPAAFTSIAENIQKTIPNNTAYSAEQFANAVLSLVRQIPYNVSDVKYPVEALVENFGDCDVLSLLAASIMKAGGLDVVLLYYEDINPSHINIGVYLPYKPVYHSWWTPATGFTYNNKTYWMAEATPLGPWKIGEKPELLATSKPTIIPLDNVQKTSPGKISSSLDTPLLPSAISIVLTSDNSNQTSNTRPLTILGTISPQLPNKTVTMYISQPNYVQVFKTTTNETGKYSFNWNLPVTSSYQIQTSCTDISNFTTADSDTYTVFGSNRPTTREYDLSILFGRDAFPNSTIVSIPEEDFVPTIKDFLKSYVSGTGALLSGEFTVLNNAPNEYKNMPTSITVQHTFWLYQRNKPPAKTIIPEVIPLPMIPNATFGFILQQIGDNNYTASVKTLQDQDTALNAENTVFMNASQITKENTWYKITATISETATNATIYEENGTPLNNVTPSNDSATTDQIGVLLAYNPGAVLVFRNLKAETLDEPAPHVTNNQKPENTAIPPAMYIGLIAVLIVALTAIVLVKKRKQTKKIANLTNDSATSR